VLGGLAAVTAVERARPVSIGGTMSAIADGPQTMRTALFTPENIKEGSFSLRYLFKQDDPYDGYEVEFFDAKDFSQDVRIWPKASVRPRTIPLLGCTDPVQAEQYARWLWQQDTYTRKSVVFETEMEGLIYALGERFAVAHPLPNWGAAARVTRVNGRVLLLDKAFGPVTNPYVFLRSDGDRDHPELEPAVSAVRQGQTRADLRRHRRRAGLRAGLHFFRDRALAARDCPDHRHPV
jgi:predicted phage tail protein